MFVYLFIQMKTFFALLQIQDYRHSAVAIIEIWQNKFNRDRVYRCMFPHLLVDVYVKAPSALAL